MEFIYEMMLFIFGLSCIFVVTFFFRSLVLFPAVDLYHWDTPFHVNAIFDMWKNGIRHICYFDRMLISSELSYPFLFHQLMALVFSPKHLRKYSEYVSPFLASLLNGVFFTCAFGYSLYSGHNALTSLRFAVQVGLLLIFSVPVLISSIFKFSHFGERGFGYLMGTLAFLGIIYGVYLNSYILLLISVILCMVIFHTSQFASQAIILINLIFSLVIWDIRPLGVIGISVGLMFLVFPKYFIRFINFKYLHLIKFYYPTLKHNFRSLGWIYDSFLIKKMMLKAPFFYLGLGGAAVLVFGFNPDYHLSLHIGFWISSVIVCMIVYIPSFRVIGEAHRYVEYGIYSYLIILVSLFSMWNHFIYWGILLLLASIYMTAVLDYKMTVQKILKDSHYIRDLVSFLNLFQEKVILSIPSHQFHYYLMNQTSHRFVDGIPVKDVDKYFDIFVSYQIPRIDLDYIYDKYPFDFVVVDRGWLKGKRWKYDFTGMKIIFANRKFLVYEKGIC